MAVSRRTETDQDLEDAAVADACRTYIALQARDWQRRQRNRVLPAVLRLVDEARSNGDAPDIPALIKQVFLDRDLPELEG
jgi:hypothetical protein